MRAQTEIKVRRIRKVGQILKGAFMGFAVLTAILLLVAVFRIVAGRGFRLSAFSMSISTDTAVTVFNWAIPLEGLSLSARIVLAAIVGFALAIQMKALIHLRQLFDDYSDGRIFTTQAARQIRLLGLTTMSLVVPNILWVVAGFVYARNEMPHAIHLDLNVVLLGMIVTFLSWFMDAAAEMREENELTV
jgi:hypothetical protein